MSRGDGVVGSLAHEGANRPVAAPPTMREVARLAGVSLKTVSRVMNAESTVAEPTRQRVLDAAEQLDYRINLTAGSLRRKDNRTRTIGLLLPSVANPFSAELHRAVEETVGEHGFSVFAASLDENAEREHLAVQEFVRRRVDGLIITPTQADQAAVLRSDLREHVTSPRPMRVDAVRRPLRLTHGEQARQEPGCCDQRHHRCGCQGRR